LTIILIVLRPWSFANALWRNWLLLIPLALAIASVNWSINPDPTFRRAIALVLTTLFAIYVASRYEWGAFIELFATCFLILAGLSLLMALVMPEIGIMSEIHPGAWSGIYWEKNQFGMNMVKAAHLAIVAAIYRPQRRMFWGGVFLLAVMLVLMSTSKTSLMALMLSVFGMIGLYLVRKGPQVAFPLVYFAVVFGVGLVMAIEFFPEFMFGLIGREPTLTGRTDIWNALFDQIRNRPIWGHGYAIFWLDETGPAFWVRQRTEWLVPTAHNGWLETWLSIGLVGVACFALVYATALITALRGLLKGTHTYWALISTLVFLLFSMSESNILQQNNLGWLLFAATAAKLFGARPLPFGSKYRSPIELRLKPAKPEYFAQALGGPIGYFGPLISLEDPVGQGQNPIDQRLTDTHCHPVSKPGQPAVLPSGLRRPLAKREGFDQIIPQGRPVSRDFLENQRVRGPAKTAPRLLNTRK
jgi:O-antigen ligase